MWFVDWSMPSRLTSFYRESFGGIEGVSILSSQTGLKIGKYKYISIPCISQRNITWNK